MYCHDLNITFSISNDLAKDYIPKSLPFGEFESILKSKVHYSPFQYRENYRKEDNSVLSNTNALFLDFDDGMTIDKAKSVFSGLCYVLATTKSHQVEKNNKVCDRFRIIIPTETNINISKEEYKELIGDIIDTYGADRACKDIARFYYGHEKSEVFYNFGDLFDIEKAMEKVKKKKQIIKEMTKTKERAVISFDGTKIDTLRQISKTDKMLKILKFSDKFGSGGRNTYLFSCAKYLQENGMSDEEVKSEILWVNSQGSDPLIEKEINKTIFYSLRLL